MIGRDANGQEAGNKEDDEDGPEKEVGAVCTHQKDFGEEKDHHKEGAVVENGQKNNYPTKAQSCTRSANNPEGG